MGIDAIVDKLLQVLLPKRQGALKKRRPERKGVFSDWQHRYFVLQGKFLFYYDCDGRNARGPTFKGLIGVRTISDILPVLDDSTAFRVACPDRNLYLRAKSAEDAAAWIRSLKSARDLVTGGRMANANMSGQNFT